MSRRTGWPVPGYIAVSVDLCFWGRPLAPRRRSRTPDTTRRPRGRPPADHRLRRRAPAGVTQRSRGRGNRRHNPEDPEDGAVPHDLGGVRLASRGASSMEVRRGARNLTSGRCSIPWPRQSGGSGVGCGWRGAGTERGPERLSCGSWAAPRYAAGPVADESPPGSSARTWQYGVVTEVQELPENVLAAYHRAGSQSVTVARLPRMRFAARTVTGHAGRGRSALGGSLRGARSWKPEMIKMSVLVVYASKHGATRDRPADRRGPPTAGCQADVRPVQDAGDLAGYDAFVIGSAAYELHWRKEATQFVRCNAKVLAARSVWLFRAVRSVPAPPTPGPDRGPYGAERDSRVHRALHPRGHHVFFGARTPQSRPSPNGRMRVLPAARAALPDAEFPRLAGDR